VGAQAGECRVDIGACELELDVTVELVEAGVAPTSGSSKPSSRECLFQIGALGHVVSSND
jgi:hypothetical protein